MSYQNNSFKKTARTLFEESINKSLQALSNNKTDVAKKWVDKAIKLNKTHPAGYEVLARIYEHNGDQQQAYKIISNNPSVQRDINYKKYEGQLAANNGLYQIAINTFNYILASSPQDTSLLKGLIYCYNRTDDYINKYLTLKKLKDLQPLALDEIYFFAYAIQKIHFSNHTNSVLQDINDILENKKFDSRLLTSKTGQLLLQHYPELSTPEKIQLDHDIFLNPLPWSILSKICIANINIDRFLMYTRKSLLLHTMEKGLIDDALLPILQSISAQNFLNEYIHYIDATEKEIIQGLLQVIELSVRNPDWTPTDSEAIFHILLMYMPLHEMNFKDILYKFPLDTWPNSLTYIAQKTLFSPQLEIEIGHKTAKITAISSETPVEVNRQYEENPYPRWQGTYCNPSHTLGAYINHFHPNLSLGKDFFKPSMRILIAGCGTGKQAIDSALIFPNCEIIAFDISLRSLGYAQIKAKEYDANNITFFHGDILELNDDIGLFDYIECCGVLHHLKNPMQGWQKLIERLKPNGVMRIDLYSKIARKEITERKKQIAELNIGTSVDSLRMFRNAIIAQNTDNIFSIFSDFYNTSEFRDLLFHTQETQYTLPEIKETIKKLGLDFVAMFVEQDKQAIFKQEYPDGNIHDLTLWNEVEIKNPNLFASMYAFWCQKKS